MDIKQLTNVQLIAKAFGVSQEQAEESLELFFPENGCLVVRDSAGSSLRDCLRAAIELDRRMATESLEIADSPAGAKSLIQRAIGRQEHESFWAVFLDAQHKAIAIREMGIGTTTQCSVYPREFVKCALALNASGVILAHNHPSGTCTPSRADEEVTSKLKTALALIDVRVLDHFIVTRIKVVSMAEMGLV